MWFRDSQGQQGKQRCPCGKYDFCQSPKCQALGDWLREVDMSFEEAMQDPEEVYRRKQEH